MSLFFDTTKKDILKEIPFSISQSLWVRCQKEQRIHSKASKLVVITNNELIVRDQRIVNKLVDKLKKVNVDKSKGGEQRK